MVDAMTTQIEHLPTTANTVGDMRDFKPSTDNTFLLNATSTVPSSYQPPSSACICCSGCEYPTGGTPVTAELLIGAADTGDLHFMQHAACALREDITAISDEDGMTALHVASQRGHLLVLKFLLKSVRSPVAGEDNTNLTLSNKTHGITTHDSPFDDIADKWGVGSTSASTESATTSSGTPQSRLSNINDHHQTTTSSSPSTAGGVKDTTGGTSAVKCTNAPSRWAEITSHRGHTALHWAAIKGHTACVRELLKSGFNINATSRQGATPLQLAVASEKTDVVRLLVRSGADVNSVTASGSSPSKVSSFLGNIAIVEALRGEENYDDVVNPLL